MRRKIGGRKLSKKVVYLRGTVETEVQDRDGRAERNEAEGQPDHKKLLDGAAFRTPAKRLGGRVDVVTPDGN